MVTGLLVYYHWEAMLVVYLASRKTVLPFTNVENMYSKTPFRLAMIPDTSYVDGFKYSLDPRWQRIYNERIEPHLQEYIDYPGHLSDMVNFIRDDYQTALYDGFVSIA